VGQELKEIDTEPTLAQQPADSARSTIPVQALAVGKGTNLQWRKSQVCFVRKAAQI
jgi:hypothetical protein